MTSSGGSTGSRGRGFTSAFVRPGTALTPSASAGRQRTVSEPEDESPDVTCQRHIGLANDALNKKNVALAAYHFRIAQGLATPATRGSVLDVDSRLKQAAQEILDKATEDYSKGRYVAAMKTYDNLVRWMPGFPVAIKAKEQLAAAEKDPAVQTALQEMRAKAFYARAVAIVQGKTVSPTSQPVGDADETPDVLITAADVRNLPVERQLPVVDTLQSIVRTYPASQQGQQCRRLLAELDKEPGFKAGIEQYRTIREARQAYELGRNYQSTGKTRQAIEQYRLACGKCPGSEWAKRSQLGLAELRTK